MANESFDRLYDAGVGKAEWHGDSVAPGSSVSEVVDTAVLLEAVDVFDAMRPDVSDTEGFVPPKFRSDLLSLHQLAMKAFPDGFVSAASWSGDEEMLELADELESVAWTLHENAERLWDILDAFNRAAAPDDEEEDVEAEDNDRA